MRSEFDAYGGTQQVGIASSDDVYTIRTPDNNLLHIASEKTVKNVPERRHTPRIYDPFPTKVQGLDVSGKSFEVTTVLDNISAGGIYLRLNPTVNVGTSLSIVFQLPSFSTRAEGTPPRVAVQGKILRVEPKHGGVQGIAVAITQHRFM